MKLTIEKGQLLNCLNTVSKGMSSRSTLPILSGIHLETSNGSLVFRTTDLEVSIQHSAPVLVESDGATVVPGKLFSEIIKSFPEAAVGLEQNDEQLTVRCLDTVFNIHTLNPSDFPLFPQFDSHLAAKIPAAILASMIKKVVKSVSKDESRATLTGVLVKLNQDELQLVATDSYRLAIAKNSLEQAAETSIDLIVPGIILDEIRRLISSEKEVVISNSENQVIFSFGETIFITRKIEGSYPNYDAIIPKENNITAVVDTQALLGAVKRASITTQAHTPIRLNLDSHGQCIEISSKTQDVASSQERVTAQIDGEGLEIGFNHQYIIDGLSVIDSDELLFEAQTALKPGIFKSISDEYFFYLTMPIRIES